MADNRSSLVREHGTQKSSCKSARCLRRQANGTLDVTPTGQAIDIYNENALSSLLLKLPAELRRNIWVHVIGQHDIRRPSSAPNADQEFLPLSFLLTCRQIYSEAAPLIFIQHTLIIRPEIPCLRLRCCEKSFSIMRIHVHMPNSFEGGEYVAYILPIEEFEGLDRTKVEVNLWYEYDSDQRRYEGSVDEFLEKYFQGRDVTLRHKAQRFRTASSMMWEGIWDEVDEDVYFGQGL